MAGLSTLQRPGRCEGQVLPGFTGLSLEKGLFYLSLSDITDHRAACNTLAQAMRGQPTWIKSTMLEKELLENGYVRVTFRVSHYIWADCITLVGEFNNWDAHSYPLRRTRDDGEWHTSLVLESNGAYRFRYLVDGKEWMDDDHADGYEPNPFGGFDSVVFT